MSVSRKASSPATAADDTVAPVAALTELIAFLDELLEPERFEDYGPNGLQVPGGEDVRVVVTGVSAGRELFERAIDAGAGLVLVHHGLFWKGRPLAIDGPAKARLKLLFDHDVALAAYHLPLDGHQEHGNNALLAAALGADRTTPFPAGAGSPIGVVAHLPGEGITPQELVDRTRVAVGGREPLAFLDGPDRVRTVGIVSGGGSPYLSDAVSDGPRRLPDGRADRARHARGARERRPFRGRRALRHGDARRPPPRRSARWTIRRRARLPRRPESDLIRRPARRNHRSPRGVA